MTNRIVEISLFLIGISLMAIFSCVIVNNAGDYSVEEIDTDELD